MYVDDVTFGNPLAVRDDARRQAEGVYWCLYQMGAAALAYESCLFEIAAFQASRTRTFVGVAAHLVGVCLSCFLTSDIKIRFGVRFMV